MGRPLFAPKITPFHRPIPKSNYLPHPWARRPTIPNRIHMWSTIFPQCTGQTHKLTHRQKTDRWLPGKFDDYRPSMLYRQQRGLKITKTRIRCYCTSKALVTQCMLSCFLNSAEYAIWHTKCQAVNQWIPSTYSYLHTFAKLPGLNKLLNSRITNDTRD